MLESLKGKQDEVAEGESAQEESAETLDVEKEEDVIKTKKKKK